MLLEGNLTYNIWIIKYFWLIFQEPLKAPQNPKAVASDTRIIVKWTADQDIGLKETFIVEYRKHFDSSWRGITANDRSTAILNGLHPNEFYFLRVYSKTAAGESDKTDVIIVKTGDIFINNCFVSINMYQILFEQDVHFDSLFDLSDATVPLPIKTNTNIGEFIISKFELGISAMQ